MPLVRQPAIHRPTCSTRQGDDMIVAGGEPVTGPPMRCRVASSASEPSSPKGRKCRRREMVPASPLGPLRWEDGRGGKKGMRVGDKFDGRAVDNDRKVGLKPLHSLIILSQHSCALRHALCACRDLADQAAGALT